MPDAAARHARRNRAVGRGARHPATADFVDVIVTGKVVDSNGGFMAVDITAIDAAGRVWIKDKRYSSLVDLGAYKTTAALKARDPFQNVYSEIANDMVVTRDKLIGARSREHPQGREPQVRRRISRPMPWPA